MATLAESLADWLAHHRPTWTQVRYAISENPDIVIMWRDVRRLPDSWKFDRENPNPLRPDLDSIVT
jgi:hypothetical protein